ncbi:MAG: O-antigen ligase family protein [Bradymonadales bacterium]|nr:O-antigen ligase family protein [Bradymonadales bacterium]
MAEGAPRQSQGTAGRKDQTGTSLVFEIASAVLVGLVAGLSLVMAGGKESGAVLVGLVIAMAWLTITRPLWGLYVVVAAVLVANEPFLPLSGWTTDLGAILFDNWWKLLSPEGTRRMGFLAINSVEVLWVSMAVGMLVTWTREKRRPWFSGELTLAILFLLSLGVMLGYGLATGGGLRPAFWQIRGLVHLVAFALLVPQLIETPAHVQRVVWVLFVPIVFKALQADWIFLVDRRMAFGEWEHILGHEDSMFFVAAILLAIVLFLHRVDVGQRELLLVSLPFIAMALIVNLRRVSYVALAVCLVLVPILLAGRRLVVLKWGLPLLVVLGVYGAIYWDRPDTTLGYPLEQVRSILMASVGSAEYDSNMYRLAEDINLQRTIAGHPFGLGFGHPFELHVPLADIDPSFELWQYHPHNTLLGLWMSAGPIGLLFFLAFCGSLILQSCHGLRRQVEPYYKSLHFLAITAFTSGLIMASFDFYIGTSRGSLFLGVVAGIALAVRRFDDLGAQEPKTTEADASASRGSR